MNNFVVLEIPLYTLREMNLLGVTNYRSRNTKLLNACYESETQRDLQAPSALLGETSYAGNLALHSGIPGDPFLPVVYLFSELAKYTV